MKKSRLGLLLVLTCSSAAAGVFPDCSYTPPRGWNPANGDPVFVLSQDYPTTDPSPSLTQPWKAIDFRQQPAAYMQAVIDYCYEGNLEVEFRGQDNAMRQWYHAPWLHPGTNRRGITHRLTGERLSRTRELPGTHSKPLLQLAVGLY